MELISVCVFAIGALVLGVIGLLALAVYFQKREGESTEAMKDNETKPVHSERNQRKHFPN